MTDGVYALDQLGWLQFEVFCSAVLVDAFDLSDLAWLGPAGRVRTAVVDASITPPRSSRPLPTPVNVMIVWVPEQSSRLDVVDRFRIAADEVELGRAALVLTNAPSAIARDALRLHPSARGCRLVVLGGKELGRLVDERVELRVAMPPVLSVCDLSTLIAPELADASVFDLDGAQSLARVFWPTTAYGHARTVLARHRFVVLTGPPEMGKTAIARMLALALMTDGWQVRECTRPEDVFAALDPARRQVFIADDAFGSTEYQPDAGERWAQAMGRLLPRLDDQHWLIWTSRPAPLKAGLRRVQRERGAERFPSPGEVTVDASDLTLAEKTLILFRHAKASDALEVIRGPIREAGVDIVEHAHFTPERIRRLVALASAGEGFDLDTRSVRAGLTRLIATPTEAMRNSYRALGDEHRELLIALLDAPAGMIDERELAATVRRHRPGALSRPPCELIDRLTDHFLRVTSLGIGWVHPSWRDLVIDELRGDAAARERFLRSCSVDGVLLAISGEGGVAGERSLPLLAADRDWDALGDRCAVLVRELEDAQLVRLLVALASLIERGWPAGDPAEAACLAGSVLEMTARAWAAEQRPLPVALIEAWYGLRAVLEHPAQLSLAATWIELHPGSPLDEIEPADVVRLDEWLAVAEVLQDRDLVQLASFRFHAHRDLIAEWALRLVDADEIANRALVAGVVDRMRRLFPDFAVVDAGAIVSLRLAREKSADAKWWVPEDIAAPPSTELVAETRDFERADVRRVLADL